MGGSGGQGINFPHFYGKGQTSYFVADPSLMKGGKVQKGVFQGNGFKKGFHSSTEFNVGNHCQTD
jgi:hypothetical protein